MNELTSPQLVLVFLFGISLAEHISKVPRHYSYATHLLFDDQQSKKAILRIMISTIFFAIIPLIFFWLALASTPDVNFASFSMQGLISWLGFWPVAFLFPNGIYRVYVGVLLYDAGKGKYTFDKEWDEGGWGNEKINTGGKPIYHILGGILYIEMALLSLFLSRLVL